MNWTPPMSWKSPSKPDVMLHWSQGAVRLDTWLSMGLLTPKEWWALREAIVGPLVMMW